LPFEPELFDLVVVDEASQVNMPRSFPRFIVAHASVWCDDKQLGLNSAGLFMLNQKFEEMIWNKHFPQPGVSYSKAKEQLKCSSSKDSILDFISSIIESGKGAKTTLDEHFRSYPQLASFTSDTFYQVDVACG